MSLTLAFPAPFPLTLAGDVKLLTNSATFTGLPDIPLTDLTVSLFGGAQGLFLSTCQTPSGTATATLTDQNADRTTTVPSGFTVSGCSSPGATGAAVPGATAPGPAASGAAPATSGSGRAGLGKGRAVSRSKHHRTKRARHPRRHRRTPVG